MREIKFRAWDTVNNEMYPPEEIINLTGNMTQELTKTNSVLTIEQFTGLTDKNGKEIYEGDVVERFGGEYGNAIVEWHKNGFWSITCVAEEWSYGTDQNLFSETHEIIGNIHENPELLK